MKDLYKYVWFAENQFILSTYKPFMVKLYHELNSIDFKEPIKVKSDKLLKFLIKIKLLERF